MKKLTVKKVKSTAKEFKSCFDLGKSLSRATMDNFPRFSPITLRSVFGCFKFLPTFQ